MITVDALQWVVFDDTGARALADDKALVRWAQSQGLTSVGAWHAQVGTHTMAPCHLHREGVRWTFGYPSGWSCELEPVQWDVPADPSDNPLVLRIVELIETAAAQSVLETVRWTLEEWPPLDLHADVDPRLIGQRIGSVYDLGVIDDTTIGRYWHYCPDRIAAVADDLVDDLALRQLVAYLEGRINLTMTHERLDPEERERYIDQSFLDANPALQQIITPVLFRAMDMEL